MKLKTLSLLIAVLGTSHGATLVDWNLDEQTPQGAGVTFAGISASSADILAEAAPYLTVTDLITASRNASFTGLTWSTSNAASGELNLQNWDFLGTGSSANGDGSADNWLQFSITAATGYQLTLNQISISAWRNGVAAASVWSGQYSIDNGATWVTLGNVHNEAGSGGGSFTDVDFTGSVTDDSFLIRFTATGTPGGTGNIHINRFIIGGELSAVPEPSSAFLGALSLASFAFLRRRQS